MRTKDFYALTLEEWHYVSKAYMIKDERASQRIRTLATLMVNLQLDKDKHLKPEELWRLPSDKIIKVKKELPTYEEMMEVVKKYRKE